MPAEALEAVSRLKSVGAVLVVVSNQPAAAKGTTTLTALAEVNDAIVAAYANEGLAFDRIMYCHHHPDGVDPDLTGPCDCRKPSPGMLVRATTELGIPDDVERWMIGDSDVDIEAGCAAGATTILVEEPLSEHRRMGNVTPDHRVGSVLSAADLVVAGIRRPSPGET